MLWEGKKYERERRDIVFVTFSATEQISAYFLCCSPFNHGTVKMMEYAEE
jgi:hypothetical protein